MSGPVTVTNGGFPFDSSVSNAPPPTGGVRRRSRKASRKAPRRVRRAGQSPNGQLPANPSFLQGGVADAVMEAGNDATMTAAKMTAAADALRGAGARLKKTAKKVKKVARRH